MELAHFAEVECFLAIPLNGVHMVFCSGHSEATTPSATTHFKMKI